MTEAVTAPPETCSVLYVDDEATSRRWFARALGNEFSIVTADSVDEALAVLAERGASFAVLVTDFRMPGADGMKLLRAVQEDHRHLVRLLVTAYAGKEVAMAAVNQGKVLRILEKPLEDAVVREALHEAVAVYRTQAMERAANEGRLTALRETLGFLAHELNTPLATARGCVATVAERYLPAKPGDEPGVVRFAEHHPGELIAALERAERRALYCQSLVSTFVQSARDAYPGAAPASVTASGLLESLLDEFPFEEGERSCVLARVEQDFRLPGRRDLLYLVLCTLAKNALQALRGRPDARLVISAGATLNAAQSPQAWIRFADNGPGIPPDVLARLTREPVTTRAGSGGNGMGVLFCQRVMLSLGGTIAIESPPGQGAKVTLTFNRLA
ncbi:MAG TPA: hybrid sensor histidine kinase/response regulator [Ramlibacter sp.]|nr:hybrid sensor histidine kinase/response regulator [Ramlibacter sp.]